MADGGSFTLRANGSWEFNPGTDFDDLKAGVTKTTSVEYTASDGSLTDTATLTVTVTGANDGLTANDDAGTTTENTELTVADGATGTTSGTTTGPGGGAQRVKFVATDIDRRSDHHRGGGYELQPSVPMAPGNSIRARTLTI